MLFSKFFHGTLTYTLYNMIWTGPAAAQNVTAGANPAQAYCGLEGRGRVWGEIEHTTHMGYMITDPADDLEQGWRDGMFGINWWLWRNPW